MGKRRLFRRLRKIFKTSQEKLKNYLKSGEAGNLSNWPTSKPATCRIQNNNTSHHQRRPSYQGSGLYHPHLSTGMHQGAGVLTEPYACPGKYIFHKKEKLIGRKRKGNSKKRVEAIDMDVLIYQLVFRMVMIRVSDQEYNNGSKQAEKSAKANGVGVGKEHKIRCRDNLYITNVEKKILPIEK